jgi:hypothetical protein
MARTSSPNQSFASASSVTRARLRANDIDVKFPVIDASRDYCDILSYIHDPVLCEGIACPISCSNDGFGRGPSARHGVGDLQLVRASCRIYNRPRRCNVPSALMFRLTVYKRPSTTSFDSVAAWGRLLLRLRFCSQQPAEAKVTGKRRRRPREPGARKRNSDHLPSTKANTRHLPFEHAPTHRFAVRPPNTRRQPSAQAQNFFRAYDVFHWTNAPKRPERVSPTTNLRATPRTCESTCNSSTEPSSD